MTAKAGQDHVEIVEVGPRDGLQNEKAVISVAQKAELIHACAAAGQKSIEMGSFVNPERVPQMADTGAVMRAVGALEGVRGIVLVPTVRRLQEYILVRAQAQFDMGEIAVFVSATEAFSQANLGCSVDESLSRVAAIMDKVPEDVAVRGYISCVTDCPFEGLVDPVVVSAIAGRLQDLGCDTLALADTIGKGTPDRVGTVFEGALKHWSPGQVGAHFHDTVGLALANVDVALGQGVRSFDSSVAGLGGCPYAPGAPGNLATEALLAHLSAAGYETGVDAERLTDAAGMARQMVGR
ncbi:MAG: hydroxymethylglutaryl-CoA lyase [Rhodobacteraceae bacterium]|nr:hydroxymethylglutaryl-CoA lyase [Paracoccaceae bacterium]